MMRAREAEGRTAQARYNLGGRCEGEEGSGSMWVLEWCAASAARCCSEPVHAQCLPSSQRTQHSRRTAAANGSALSAGVLCVAALPVDHREALSQALKVHDWDVLVLALHSRAPSALAAAAAALWPFRPRTAEQLLERALQRQALR